MTEFYIVFSQKIFSRFYGGGAHGSPASPPLSHVPYAYAHNFVEYWPIFKILSLSHFLLATLPGLHSIRQLEIHHAARLYQLQYFWF